MSDFWASLWKGVSEGWNNGWNAGAPTLGPSVGRGLFSDPFLSERDRDVRELQALYQRVRTGFEASILVDEDRFDAALFAVFRDACVETGCTDYERVVSLAYKPLYALARNELFAFPEVEIDAWRTLTLRDQSELRALLLRRERQLARSEEAHAYVFGAARLLLSRILNESGEGPSSAEGLTLQASALDLLHEPAETVEFAWRLFFADELKDLGFYEGIRAQLERNALFTCRVDAGDPEAWTRKVYLPTRAKGRSPRELVSDYLADTPVADLFDASVPLTLSDEVRFEHTHILGGSGHGKSQLLLHLIHSDLVREDGPGLIVIDSQGDLVRTLSRLELFAPGSQLASRLVLIDPADIEYPAALSLFDMPSERMALYGPAERERLLNGAIEMYEYVFSSLLGAELTQKQGVIFRFLARLMMAIPSATLHTFLDLMEHGERFRDAMKTLDGTARRFFDEEFFHPSFSATKKQIAKRLWGILASPVFERMFSQPKGKIDFFQLMQERKIILISTAKDLLRQDGAEMFGRFLIAKITQSVMERAALPERERSACFIYIDEAQEYVDEQMALLLNQARKYRVGLALAHQNLDQLPPSLRASVMSSTSVKFAGGVSSKDARAIAEDFGTDADFLQSMRKRRGRTDFACYIRNQTPRALSVSISLGAVNALSRTEVAAFEQLLAENRFRYCRKLAPRDPPAETPTSSNSPTFEADPITPPASTQPKEHRLAGKGGSDHKYLQHLVRAAAHERGFKADIEFAVGERMVDVAIDAGGVRIACEISITTDAEHEARNVQKCLAAGFHAVWVIVPNGTRKPSLAKALRARFGAEQIAVMTTSETVAALDALAVQSPADATSVRGYKVMVRAKENDPDQKRRSEIIAGILARSMRSDPSS